MLYLPSLVSMIHIITYLDGWVLSLISSYLKVFSHQCYYLISTYIFQELNHLRAVAILMTFIMVVSVLTSIAIIRRILMATSVLKASVASKFYM